MKNILILNTGGTFSKVYNELNGKLVVPKCNKPIKSIIKHTKLSSITIKGLIYKDSLDITPNDRKEIVAFINNSNFKRIIIVHGTDTINITAQYLKDKIKDKIIILTGSMIPFSINPIEATANLISSYIFIKSCKKNNIYIAMHGLIKKNKRIKKNKKLGIFESL